MPLYNPPYVTELAHNLNVPQGSTRFVIYVRTSGNDVTGTGTFANPYRTVVRALEDPPDVIRGSRYVIDCTDIGLEMVPDGFKLRHFISPDNFVSNFFGPWPEYAGFTSEGPITIQATPKLASTIPAADAVVAAGEIVSQVADAQTGLYTVTTTKVWPVNALKGMATGIDFGIPGLKYPVAIVSNTASAFKVASNFALPATGFSLVEDSAELKSPGSQTFAAWTSCGVQLNGIKLSNTSLNFRTLQVQGSTVFRASLCDITGIEDRFVSPVQPLYNGCVLRGAMFWQRQVPDISYSCVFNATWNAQAKGAYALNCFSVIFDGCTGIGHSSGSVWGFGLDFSNVQIQAGTGSGLVIGVAGARSVLVAMRIDTCVGDAITVFGSVAFAAMGIKGAGNGGYGINLQGISNSVAVGADMDVTGALGDMKVGSLAMRTWAAFRAVGPTQYIEFDTGFLTGKTQNLLRQ